jgi:hypothetical protein
MKRKRPASTTYSVQLTMFHAIFNKSKKYQVEYLGSAQVTRGDVMETIGQIYLKQRFSGIDCHLQVHSDGLQLLLDGGRRPSPFYPAQTLNSCVAARFCSVDTPDVDHPPLFAFITQGTDTGVLTCHVVATKSLSDVRKILHQVQKPRNPFRWIFCTLLDPVPLFLHSLVSVAFLEYFFTGTSEETNAAATGT